MCWWLYGVFMRDRQFLGVACSCLAFFALLCSQVLKPRIMKSKLFVLGAASLLLASCSNELDVPVNQAVVEGGCYSIEY